MATCTVTITDTPNLDGVDIKVECDPPLEKDGMKPKNATYAQLLFFNLLEDLLELQEEEDDES